MDDVSKRQQADHTLPSDLSEAEVWAMIEASPDGMLLADELGVILFLNSQMETMFGFDRGELLGQPIEILLPERHRKIHAAHRLRYRVEPSSRVMGSGLNLVARHSTGTEFPVEISLSPIKRDEGLRVVATVRDITNRLKIENHTQAVMDIIDAAHDGVFMFGPDDLHFNYVNHGAVRQLGYGLEELLAMTPLHIKPDFTEQTFRAMLAPLIAEQVESLTITTVHRRKNGTDVPVEITLNYPPSPHPGHPRSVVALVRDITRRLRTERAAQTQQMKVQLLEERERVARDLHDLVIQRLFAAGIGLQAVQSLATNTTLDERIGETIDQLDQTIDELRSAIFRLTTPSGSTLLKLEERLDEAAVSLGHQPTLELVGDPESIEPVVFDQLLATLAEALSNVARHAHATETTIHLDVSSEAVVLSVADNGVGIDPTAPRGNGLTNLENRAAELGGAAAITSSSDAGTTLTWTVPRS